MTTGAEPRAEELIAEIFRQKRLLEAAGAVPSRVRLPLIWIRRIRVYRLLLGPLPDAEFDYLQTNSLFGLEFVLDNLEKIIVE
jgi:hypothetical protein